jgi:AcrR family transcriptional regulator
MTPTSVPDPGDRSPGGAVARRTDGPPPRERILAAALTAFSSVGFEGASTRQIARDAQVTHQLVGHYFATKKVLWEAVVTSAFKPSEILIRARFDGLRGADRRTIAKLVMKDFVINSARHPELNRIVLQEAKSGGDRLRWLVDNHGNFLKDLIIQLLEPLGVRPGDPEMAGAYYTLVGAGATVFSAAQECQLLFDLDPFDQDFVEAHAERTAEMVIASIECRQ